MAEPTKKNPNLETAFQAITGNSRVGSIKDDLCVINSTHDATKFKDKMSEREYTISGMCQACQDSVFGTDGEEL